MGYLYTCHTTVIEIHSKSHNDKDHTLDLIHSLLPCKESPPLQCRKIPKTKKKKKKRP